MHIYTSIFAVLNIHAVVTSKVGPVTLTWPVNTKLHHQPLNIKHILSGQSYFSPLLHIVSQEKRVMNTAGHQILLNCLEILQRALKGEDVGS